MNLYLSKLFVKWNKCLILIENKTITEQNNAYLNLEHARCCDSLFICIYMNQHELYLIINWNVNSYEYPIQKRSESSIHFYGLCFSRWRRSRIKRNVRRPLIMEIWWNEIVLYMYLYQHYIWHNYQKSS